MKTINIKLFRDLKSTWGQALAIIMVIAAGVATFIMSMATLDSLLQTRDSYYRDYFFADVFVDVNRAPENLRERITAIKGVANVETRVVAAVKVSLNNFSEPIIGKVVSVPGYRESLVNQLHFKIGRQVDPGRDDEVLVNEAFADAHQLQLGDKLEIIIKGRLQVFTIVGIALSPEFIYQIAPGAIIPDFKRFAVLWMARDVLDNAFDMGGSFNNVVLTVQPGAKVNDIIDSLDLLLARYGGRDALERYWQTSHRIFKSDLESLEQMAVAFSTIFLGIAAFLLNIVVSRLISAQRELIATLKAFGYSNADIILHYLGYVTFIVFAGLLAGSAFGIWLAHGLIQIYLEFYRLPLVVYEFRPEVFAIAGIITFLAAASGTLFAVARAVKLPPAQAMQPEPPAKYSKGIIDKLGLRRFFSLSVRMISRHIERKPIKASMSVIGIALASGIMVVGIFFNDAIEFMIDIEFDLAQRQDISVSFIAPTSLSAYHELQRMPGVLYGEVFRSLPARLRNKQYSHLTSINAYSKNRDLQRTLNMQHEPIVMPQSGVLLTDYLAQLLNVKVGDEIFIEVMEGKQPIKSVQVAGLVTQYIGVAAYMDLDAANRLMAEGDTISGVFLKIDPAYETQIYNKLRDMPQVANFELRKNVINAFYGSMAEFILVFVGFISFLAVVITFGVVYNSAQITLSERARELASMRVLGFSKAEISFILLGELAILTLLAIPVGLAIGKLLSWYMTLTMPQDIFRVPLIIEPSTYAMSASVVIVAAILSALLVRRRLDKLDLIAVLKTKE